MERHDVVVIGGGLMGAALAWGLAGAGRETLILDSSDLDPRASRANLGLVWVSDKGYGAPAYALLSKEAALLWPDFAATLEAESGVDLQLKQPGGFSFALSEQEFMHLQHNMASIAAETAVGLARYEVLSRQEVLDRVPSIGKDVVGAIFCPYDGHVNSLRLFKALQIANARRGVIYRANTPVKSIEPADGGFRVTVTGKTIEARNVVLAAGVENARLAPMVGLHAPLMRSKGQVIVTEKCKPFFPYVAAMLRQTGEGSILIGESEETSTDAYAVNHDVSAVLASRAVRMFPLIGALNVVRVWTGFRVKTPDGLPIYEQSSAYPGAFLMLAHSGVTLTAMHAVDIAAQIAQGTIAAGLKAFSSERFHVS